MVSSPNPHNHQAKDSFWDCGKNYDCHLPMGKAENNIRNK